MYLPRGCGHIRHLYIIYHHPYIDSTTVLSDTIQVCKMVVMNIIRLNFNLTLAIASLPKVGSKFRVESQIESFHKMISQNDFTKRFHKMIVVDA